MATIEVICPGCKKDQVILFGLNSAGHQRYQCKNRGCSKNTFLLSYVRRGDLPEIKEKILAMALNGSGVRDTARVLGVSINTVISVLKKRGD